MAEEKEQEETHEEEKEKKSSNLLLIIIIIVLFLIIIIGGIVAFILLSDDTPPTQTAQPAPQTKSVQTQQPKRVLNPEYERSRKLSEIGVLYPLDTFTVNLKSDAGRRYLKVTIALELSGQELSAELDAKTPVLRDRIIRILTSKTLEEVTSKKGKQKLSDQIMEALNAMLTDGEIKGIYFTEFVIQ
ncbi:Flagellar biosynthesis protein FliL [hydrothermal vent metagenome]|uniref:Flagellar biosynthesis protein FliL n=1 Tax=hydrothermal vent metagenome TaxID=652676 RepID=A0A1W1D5S5_9ZZZZ